MRTGDLVGSAVGGLWRQKARTALTLAGVAVGGCALAFSLSLGIGLRALIDREFRSRPGYWDVHVSVKYQGSAVPEADIPADKLAVAGEMSADRRRRLRDDKVRQYQETAARRPPTPLTYARLSELRALPDVTDVVTAHGGYGVAWLGDTARDANVVAVRTDPALAARLVAGRLPASETAAECVVSEALLYDLGAADEAAVAAALGRPLRVAVGGVNNAKHLNLARLLGVNVRDLTPAQEQALDRVTTQLPKAIDQLDLSPIEKAMLKTALAARDRKPAEPVQPWQRDETATATFTVVGVVRGLTAEEQAKAERVRTAGVATDRAGVVLPGDSGNALFDQLPWVRESGFNSATLTVRPGGDLKGVATAVEAMGFQQFSAAEWHDSVKREVTLIAAGLNLFALISLLIAALGITNTLVTSVIERTREIGVLKALGATDRQVMLLFLAEGVVIGLAGGLLGLALAFALSIPGDGFVRRLIQQQSKEKMVSESVFEFPLWLIASTVLFAAVVTTLAAAYPSRRAARIQPVEALRHE